MPSPITLANGTSVGAASGKAYTKVLGWEGTQSNGSDAVPVVFEILQPGYQKRVYLSASADNPMTAAMIASGAILTSNNPAPTTISVPTLATMGIVLPSDGSVTVFFRYQQLGVGNIFINQGAGSNVQFNWSGRNPVNFAQGQMGTLVFSGLDSNGYELWCAQ